MAEVHRLPEQRREFVADGGRSALRATWHHDAGYVVVSLWHGETCVATSHLTPEKAGRLASFITRGLAELAQKRTSPTVVTALSPRLTGRSRVRQAVRSWRDDVGRSLEQIARRLRSVQ